MAENDIQNALVNCAAVMAEDASVYVIHDDGDSINVRQAYANAGFYLSGTCIWEHGAQKAGKKRDTYVSEHTPVLFGWKKGGRHRWYADRAQTTIWSSVSPVDKPDYPVALIGYPMLNSSATNGVILAPFGGYGAVLLSAAQTGRIAYIAEHDAKKCDCIIKRFITMMGHNSSVFVNRDGETLPYTEVIG